MPIRPQKPSAFSDVLTERPSLIVRGVHPPPKPYGWFIYEAGNDQLLEKSAKRFRSMQEAHEEGVKAVRKWEPRTPSLSSSDG
jgi:hypothetical protein